MTLVPEVLALRVLQTRLLLAPALCRSLSVRAVLDTTATLHQGHAARAQLAGTRVSLRTALLRPMCAMRVLMALIVLHKAQQFVLLVPMVPHLY